MSIPKWIETRAIETCRYIFSSEDLEAVLKAKRRLKLLLEVADTFREGSISLEAEEGTTGGRVFGSSATSAIGLIPPVRPASWIDDFRQLIPEMVRAVVQAREPQVRTLQEGGEHGDSVSQSEPEGRPSSEVAGGQGNS